MAFIGKAIPSPNGFLSTDSRKSRFRSADDLEAIIRENYRQGIRQDVRRHTSGGFFDQS